MATKTVKQVKCYICNKNIDKHLAYQTLKMLDGKLITVDTCDKHKILMLHPE